MPYGTCNGDYHCDECKCDLPEETLVWVDLKKKKIYCIDCKPAEALQDSKPPLKSGQKEFLLQKILIKVLKKKNAELKRENTLLKDFVKASKKICTRPKH